VRAIEAARFPSPRLPGWWLAAAMKRFDGLCAYCGQDAGNAPDVDAVIPLVAGGPQRPDAAVLTCKACRQGRGRRDLLLWKPNASPQLRALRAALALDAWNHLSRDPADMKTPAKAADVINARWRQPRFHCHGALLPMGGFIGWREAVQVPSAMQLRLVFDHGAWRLRQSMKNTRRRNNTPAIFWVPTRQAALAALWDVIEHNGLVRAIELGMPSTSEEGAVDPSEDWKLMFLTTADLVRRQRRSR
ncbi:MAG TPA: HNH endonuclease, partial [Dyella sp.]|uniref:HNH endonuclease n=1 Tax=Dyella sp. TaxID=1869338 RepID=UPI002C2FB4DD